MLLTTYYLLLTTYYLLLTTYYLLLTTYYSLLTTYYFSGGLYRCFGIERIMLFAVCTHVLQVCSHIGM